MTEPRKKHSLNLLLGILLAATLCFIWGNSCLSRAESSQLSGGLLAWLRPALEALGLGWVNDHIIRKLAHFGEFALLGCELAALLFLNRGRTRKIFLSAELCAVVVAVIDETIQFFSARAPMVRDVLLDAAGALAGIALVWLLTRRKSIVRAD